MSVQEARRAAKKAMLYGYKHHTYLTERQNLLRFFRGEDTVSHSKLALAAYESVLAPERPRALKNGVICFVTVISRTAIECGLDSEYSFALSDYYVNQVELTNTAQELESLVQELLLNYRELIALAREKKYTPPVAKAVQYVIQNIYEPCTVGGAAEAAGVHPSYLAALFKKELGVSPSVFIAETKISEAKVLLEQLGHSVTETAEALAFSSTAHFSVAFKTQVGCSPSQYLKNGSIYTSLLNKKVEKKPV